MAAHRLAEHPLSDPVPDLGSWGPFRWLEDSGSAETQEWVRAQNQAARSHLDALASRPWFLRTMQAVVGRPRAGTPRKLGGRYVVSRNDGTQQQDLWFVADTLEELFSGGRLLIDPATLSDDGTSSLAGLTASRDGRYLAYQVSDSGSDWTSVRLMEPASGHVVDDVVTGVKFSEATWLPTTAPTSTSTSPGRDTSTAAG